MPSQFLHLASVGLEPGDKKPRWSCIAGVTSEGARLPHASRHIPFPVEPRLIYGISPIEVGRIAEECARQAYDATGKKKLRCDGTALLAGVVSYPIQRQAVDSDPCDQDIYYLWRSMTSEWLQSQFGEHLLSVVEHTDESHYHLHFYVMPTLGSNRRLNVNQIHPGYYARAVALAEGADKKHGERAYRAGMRRWQDAYHRDVSAFFDHDRYGPRRARVSRREREMQKRLEEQQARLEADLAAKHAASERELEQRRAELDRERAQLTAGVHHSAWQTYAKPNADLRAACTMLKGRLVAERAEHAAEIARLRVRLAEIEPDAAASLVVA